jgi:hypothetical protein
MQILVHLVGRKQLPENVPVCTRTEITDADKEVERSGAVRNREATVFELL